MDHLVQHKTLSEQSVLGHYEAGLHPGQLQKDKVESFHAAHSKVFHFPAKHQARNTK